MSLVSAAASQYSPSLPAFTSSPLLYWFHSEYASVSDAQELKEGVTHTYVVRLLCRTLAPHVLHVSVKVVRSVELEIIGETNKSMYV
jgi:hypothetical protein